MAPLRPGRVAASSSRAIITTGPKEMTLHPLRHSKRRENSERPSTTRALVLRNGKHGAMGTGELVPSSKITGREKLDLLAEELINKTQQAVMSPFRLEQALNISESQFGLYRDDVVNLKDPELFYDLIEADLVARTRPGVEPRRNATNLARVIGTRIHNSYMLASAWKIVSDTLKSLANQGLTDKNIKTKLKTDDEMRTRYFVLFDMVNHLVELSHSKLSVLATTAPHYAEFFKIKPAEYSAPGETEVIFEWNNNKNLRAFTQSFLDSIVIELCFPRGPFPRSILYMLLKDCLDESPNEAKRFSQAMSNAIGDLSVSVELQTLLEAPLFGPDGDAWRKEPRQMPEEFEKWVDAQFFSSKASSEITNWKDHLHPWAGVRKKETLITVWRAINMNYITIANVDIDRLWKLDDSLVITPKWSSYWVDKLAEEDEDEGDAGRSFRVGKSKKKFLAIMGPGDDEDSAASMPALQSVSNSSEDDGFSDSDSDEDNEDENYESDDSAYDSDEENVVRDLMREAIEACHEIDWFDTTTSAPESVPLQASDKRDNPFLKALGSMRGRLFNSNPKIKVDIPRTEPRPNARGAFRATPSGAPKAVPKTTPLKLAPSHPKQPETPNVGKTTMEEVEDEEANGVPSASKKKKKKKKTKRKSTGEGGGKAQVPDGPKPSTASPVSPTRNTFGASASTLSIPTEATIAQSAHSYLRMLDEAERKKDKIKSRPDHASIFSQDSQKVKVKEKTGLLEKMGRGKKSDDQRNKNPKYTWFSKLSKKATEAMHQLLHTSEDAGKQASPMKWEMFLKLMREMGFECDPSTAGSSVRFDPPNPEDSSITIHRPHPENHFTHKKLKEIAKRLKWYYGWNEEDFVKHTRDVKG